MITPKYSSIPFEVIHLDFAELKKENEGTEKTRAFLLGIDECTRIVVTKAGREDANSIIAFLQSECFRCTRAIVCDNCPAFRSSKLVRWTKDRGMTLKFCLPHHLAANGLAERAIRDIKQYLKMYPRFRGGWKCCLEAATRHHNCSYTSGLGCSPLFAASGVVPTFLADRELGLLEKLVLKEAKQGESQGDSYRQRMKRNFDKRRKNDILDIQVEDFVLIRKGIRTANDVL